MQAHSSIVIYITIFLPGPALVYSAILFELLDLFI
jgi:hypothetical protein